MEKKIIISATLDLPPEKVHTALETCRPLIEGALTQTGCLAYDWSIEPTHPGRIRVFELWENEGALAAHFRSEWYLKMRESIGSFGLRNAESAKYRVDLVEPVYDETFTARADFFTEKK
jgi:quinol monooxygenase YgiN